MGHVFADVLDKIPVKARAQMKLMLPKHGAEPSVAVKAMSRVEGYIKKRSKLLFSDRGRKCYCLKHKKQCRGIIVTVIPLAPSTRKKSNHPTDFIVFEGFPDSRFVHEQVPKLV